MREAGIIDGEKSFCDPPMRGPREFAIVERLRQRPIALVGMMGAGKTVVGRRLAARLGLDFIDSDHEIEAAARMTIPEIFQRHGEAYFRDRECRVVSRLVAEGGRVVATGGGSFIHPPTRAALKGNAVSVWLKADFDILMRRVRKRQNRPLLHTPDPEGTMRRMIAARYPIYAEADVTIISRDGPHDAVVEDVFTALELRSSNP
jgi:shikimate kinase